MREKRHEIVSVRLGLWDRDQGKAENPCVVWQSACWKRVDAWRCSRLKSTASV